MRVKKNVVEKTAVKRTALVTSSRCLEVADLVLMVSPTVLLSTLVSFGTPLLSTWYFLMSAFTCSQSVTTQHFTRDYSRYKSHLLQLESFTAAEAISGLVYYLCMCCAGMNNFLHLATYTSELLTCGPPD